MEEPWQERIRELLKKSGWPDERIRRLTKDDIAAGAPQNGVLVTLTWWSGSSRIVFAEAIPILLREQNVAVYFIDGDEYNEAVISAEKSDPIQDRISHGNGEIFWFSNGLLIHRLDIHSANREQNVAAFTKELASLIS
jgi:hypothetical protein